MEIVDSQIHLQTGGTPGQYHLPRLFPAEELLAAMAAAGVDKALLIPPTWDTNVNGPSLDAAAKYPDKFRVMGRIDIGQPDSRHRIEHWKDQPNMLGIRIVLTAFPEDAWWDGGKAEWLWPTAERAGIPIMLHVGHSHAQLELFTKVAGKYPGLKLVIDHLGAGLVNSHKDGVAFAHLPHILPLARFPNVAVKPSGLPTYSSEPWPHPALHPYLRQIYDAFGPERMFWGTDLTRKTFWDTPEKPRWSTYRQAVTMITEGIPWLSQQDKELIMGKSLRKWIGWN